MSSAAASATAISSLVAASRTRSARHGLDPDGAAPREEALESGLAQHIAHHPLTRVLDVVQSVLVDGVSRGGHVVALGDEHGRLLHVLGDRGARRRAERFDFVPGAVWREDCVGTSAPALALHDHAAVRVRGEEHYLHAAHSWSCSAAPVHDPHSGALVGLVDVTGGPAAASDEMLALVRATSLLIEAELRRAPSGLFVPEHAPAQGPFPTARGEAEFEVRLLGPGTPTIRRPGDRPATLTGRHAEIAALLAAHPEGLAGGALAELLAADRLDEVSVRAEVSRLRKLLGPEVVLSRPYRLATGCVATDVAEVASALDRGAVAAAVAAYPGPLLPTSVAPGIEEHREELHELVRAAVLHDSSPAVLAAWVHGAGDGDAEAWHRLARSPEADGLTRASAASMSRVLDRRYGI